MQSVACFSTQRHSFSAEWVNSFRPVDCLAQELACTLRHFYIIFYIIASVKRPKLNPATLLFDNTSNDKNN